MSKKVNKTRRPARILRSTLVACVLLGGLAACEETIHARGNMPDPKVVATIKPGVHRQADVRRLLGTPSTTATFEREIWYYIGGRVKTVSFFDPELIERKVVIVRFDKSGLVTAIDQHDASKDQSVDLVERETPTRGKDLTFLQQLIGNVGRFPTPNRRDGQLGN